MLYSRIVVGSLACSTESVLLCLCHQRGLSRSSAASPLLWCLHPTVQLCSWGCLLEPLEKETGFFPLLMRILSLAPLALLSMLTGSASPLSLGDRGGERAGRPPALRSLSWKPCHPALLRLCPPRADFLLGGAWQVSTRLQQATACCLPPVSPEAKAAAPPREQASAPRGVPTPTPQAHGAGSPLPPRKHAARGPHSHPASARRGVPFLLLHETLRFSRRLLRSPTVPLRFLSPPADSRASARFPFVGLSLPPCFPLKSPLLERRCAP